MKWIGIQTIYDTVRFRRDINIERIVRITNTTASSATEGGFLNLISMEIIVLHHPNHHQNYKLIFFYIKSSKL